MMFLRYFFITTCLFSGCFFFFFVKVQSKIGVRIIHGRAVYMGKYGILDLNIGAAWSSVFSMYVSTCLVTNASTLDLSDVSHFEKSKSTSESIP